MALKFSHSNIKDTVGMVCRALDIVEDGKVLFTFVPDFSKYFRNALMESRGREIIDLVDSSYNSVAMETGFFIPDEYHEAFTHWRGVYNKPKKDTLF